MCMLFPWSRISPNMEGLLTEMRIAMYMCILFPWPPISPTWRVLQREMRIAMSVCVYYSRDHIFPKHGGGCSQKWELQCLYVYIIPLITYFPIMEGGAERNGNCNVCMCILLRWSPISPTSSGLLTEMRIALSVYVYYSLGHVFPQAWRGLLREMRIAMSVCVYYSLDHLFPQTCRGLLT